MRIAKFAVAGIALSLGLGLATVAQESDAGLRRIACVNLTVFAPAGNGLSDADTCRAHGGLAEKGAAEASAALVILVRNQPAGFDRGLAAGNGS
ncbi:antitermination protein [Stappia sp. P2PMeth1]|uniref:antitermination protein n=1 Tax=Stappia sp. P2PMeth1 TaxID=2003586 RepID=UPI001643FD15|nr:antitermination protein [Stappia sp. P2PMeth1]